MLPKAIPELTKKQFEFLEKEMQRKPSSAEIERFRKAKAVYAKHEKQVKVSK